MLVNTTKENWTAHYLGVCVAVSFFSQIQPLQYILRPIMFVMWAICCMLCIVFRFRNSLSRELLIFTGLYIILSLYCVTLSITGTAHLESNYLSVLTIPLIVSYIGESLFTCLTDRKIHIVVLYLYISALLFAIWVQSTYFTSYSQWINSLTYIFTQKNSAAQIWASSLLVGFFIFKPKVWYVRYILYASQLYLVILIFISNCRTSIFALLVTLCAFLVITRKIKYFFITGLLATILLSTSSSFVQHALHLDKHSGGSLDDYSSGRIELIEYALNVINDNFMFGVGHYYMDCSYVCILAELGIIGFIIVETILFLKFYKIYKWHRNKQPFSHLLVCLAIYLWVSSMFEALPPFGPGVSAMTFWLLSSMIIRHKSPKIS